MLLYPVNLAASGAAPIPPRDVPQSVAGLPRLLTWGERPGLADRYMSFGYLYRSGVHTCSVECERGRMAGKMKCNNIHRNDSVFKF